MIVGVKGSFEMNGLRTEFSFSGNEFDNEVGFPQSAAPQSIVKGNNIAAKSQALNSYVETDNYTNNLVKDATGSKKDLLNLTHCLSKTRAESDYLLTLAMKNEYNEDTLKKRHDNVQTDDNDIQTTETDEPNAKKQRTA